MDGLCGKEVPTMSNKVEKIGLFLGKFSILHLGHQYVIDTALKEMDKLIILIYDAPSSTDIPLDVRAGWIRKIYENWPVEVIEGWCGPEETGYSEEIKQLQNEYILKMVGNRGITHFYSSEPYGEHVSQALHCINRIVDINRTTFPISASTIQKNPYLYKEYINPVVYRDLITNIVFVGAPSTGKTTIAERLANKFNTVWMPEYGREYWEKYQVNRRLEPWQLSEIAEGHLIRENEKLLQANKYLFTDTNAITTYMFAMDYHSFAEDKLVELAKAAENRYDLVFLCSDDIPYDDTWDRSGDVHRHIFQRKIESDLLQRKVPYITLKGNLEERISTVEKILGNFKKWNSVGNLWINS